MLLGQFTNSILAIEEFRDIETLRYVSETAFLDDAQTTPVDMHKFLLRLGHDQRTPFANEERAAIAWYVLGRTRYEEFIQNPDGALRMSGHKRHEFMIAQRDVSIAVARPANRLFDDLFVVEHHGPDGLLRRIYGRFRHGDRRRGFTDPDPVFVAIADRLPDIRHVYIGDVHQLGTHARGPRSSNPVVFGARSVMSAFIASARVSVAPLVTTFRAHPSLNDLPNRLTYEGTLVSGADGAERRLLLDLFKLPDKNLPFLFMDAAGTSHCAVTKSHSNEVEATVCWNIVTELTGKVVRNDVTELTGKVVRNDQICVITFYREQYRKLVEPLCNMGVEMTMVDPVQGRKKDVVILLMKKTSLDQRAPCFWMIGV
ncbi:hypothetical protein ANCDUO_05582 [Ancylostoma duodenale]|uniref:DNA2/NAM7 helicase-like C-terminal domain-containing protein n=1 Tax=Ancylostoma duodenale TaxID=51022 RepID=A0A0C2D3Q7_9BILA|nr:hypothetical protein ANCDUO_05582 [Ancylostoma duodenale]